MAILISTDAAQGQATRVTVPQLATCRGAPDPHLPERWRATYLMAPFVNGQLVLGDIVYEAALPAIRVRLFGLKGGSADVLVTAGTTYALGQGPEQGPAWAGPFYVAMRWMVSARRRPWCRR